MKINFYVKKWNDQKLTWNPEEYDNINEITIPAQNIWKPGNFIKN